MELGATRADQPHLVSLVLQSKKALQHGEQLCSRANTLSNASAQCAVDVLALDAKVKWISEAVIEQLKVRHIASSIFFYSHSPTFTQLAATVAKSIECKRAQLDKQIRVRLHRIPATSTPPHLAFCPFLHTAGMGHHPFGAYLGSRYHP